MNTSVEAWCNSFIKIGFYLLFALIPLLLTPWNYELFEYNKMMAVYIVTAFIVTSWVVKMIAQKEIRIAKTPLDIPIALFVASQLVSSIFSIDPHVSWLGYYSRFNGGMWSVICYVLLYYAHMSNGSNKTNESNLLKTALASATLVALYGALERLGIDKNLWVQDVQHRVFSTLGQPNWLAAYLVALVPIAWALAIKKPLWHIVSLLFFIVLLFTRSRSGLLGFIIADVVFWGIVFFRLPKSLKEPRSLTKTILILHIIFAAIVFANGTGTPAIDRWVTLDGWMQMVHKINPDKKNVGKEEKTTTVITGPALEVGGTESGVIRKYVWEGAIAAWRSTTKTLLIGTGVETYAFAFYQFRPTGHNLTSEWDFLYNKAHNEYLNYLATTGLFGLGSYLLFIGVFITWFIKFSISNSQFSMKISNSKFQINEKSPYGSIDPTIMSALFAGWISILVTNFFGFSVVIVQVFLFLFPAMIIASERQGVKLSTIGIRFPIWTVWIALLLGGFTVVKIGTFWYADTLFASGYQSSRAGNGQGAVSKITDAIRLNPHEPLYHDELSSDYATLAVSAAQNKNATDAAHLAALATEENGRALAISPNNVNFWKTRTKIYYTLSSLDPSLNTQAIEALSHAKSLSPNDPKIYYNLAILVGRQGDPKGAVTNLLTAKKLKNNYRDVYFALWVFYTELKQPEAAKKIIQEYLDTVDATDKDFLEKVH